MPDSDQSNIRRTIHFSGRVQGVGFRFTTESVAEKFQVTGQVRNLRDGRVELIAEGPKQEVERFQASVEDAMGSYIGEVQASDQTATGEFHGFRIAY